MEDLRWSDSWDIGGSVGDPGERRCAAIRPCDRVDPDGSLPPNFTEWPDDSPRLMADAAVDPVPVPVDPVALARFPPVDEEEAAGGATASSVLKREAG